MFKTEVKEINDLYDGMVSTGAIPIVLRYKSPCKTVRNIYGFYGYEVSTDERINGSITLEGRIDPNASTFFYPDKFRIGHAVIPKCERNVECLRSALADGLPVEIIEPIGLLDEVETSSEIVSEEVKETPKKMGRPSTKTI